MIVLRSPKGWTCPAFIDGKKCEDYWRAHQVPMADMEGDTHIAILEQWMKSYRPEELFDDPGPPGAGARGAAARGFAPHERQPAREWRRLLRELRLPDFAGYAVTSTRPAPRWWKATRVMGTFCAT